MSKPDWKDAPEGFDWLAMDEDGGWRWYNQEPEAMSVSWVTDNGDFEMADGEESELAWWETLERRP